MTKAKLIERTKYRYVIIKGSTKHFFDLEREINQIEYIFGFKLNVLFVDNIKYGYIDDKTGVIRISVNQPKSNVILTIVHEALHQVGFDHDRKMRKLGYWSNEKHRDIFTEKVARVILGRPCVWR